MKPIRKPRALELSQLSNTTFHDRIKRGLLPASFSLGGRTVAWFEEEIQAVSSARAAGKSDDEIRQLVTKLMADRKTLGAEVAA